QHPNYSNRLKNQNHVEKVCRSERRCKNHKNARRRKKGRVRKFDDRCQAFSLDFNIYKRALSAAHHVSGIFSCWKRWIHQASFESLRYSNCYNRVGTPPPINFFAGDATRPFPPPLTTGGSR
ncbi:unnamed protein product, partial [Amoebophrya sp. A120]